MRKAREALGDDARLIRARRVSGSEDPVPAYEVCVSAGPVAMAAQAPAMMPGPAATLTLEMTSAAVVQPAMATPPVVAPSPAAAASVAAPVAATFAPTSPAPAPASPASASESSFDELRREIDELKSLLREHVQPVQRMSAPPQATPVVEIDAAGEAWLDLLRKSGMGRALAEHIVKEATQRTPQTDFASAIAQVVAGRLQERSENVELGRRSTILVGPAGAGKTTTLAKLAADLTQRGIRPILVCADGESVAGEDLLARISGLLNLRFETAFFSGQLADLAARHPGEILLVDTPGRTPFSADGLEGLSETIRGLDDPEVVLVLPATTDRDEIPALVEGYRVLGAHQVVLTKVDELARPGRILDLAQAITQPIAWITYGREALGASSRAGDPALLSRVLGTARAVSARV
jgi:flagellar biosynthesis protein FlhF